MEASDTSETETAPLLKIMDDVLEADSKRFLSVLTFDAP
jgi:hypothetical protein